MQSFGSNSPGPVVSRPWLVVAVDPGLVGVEAEARAEALPPADDALVAQYPLDHVGRDLVGVAHDGGGPVGI